MLTKSEVLSLINEASGGVVNGRALRLYNPGPESKLAISQLQSLLLGDNHEIKTIIINETPGGVLIHLARQIGSTYPLDVSRPAFFYLVPIIMKQPLCEQERAFKRHTTSKFNVFTGKTIEIDDRPKQNQYLNKGEFGVARLLYQLKVKVNSLDDRKETDARDAADRLHQKLSECFLAYLATPEMNKATYDAFKIKWDKAITDEKPELEKHRGWKNFLANLALFIVTLGILHTGAAVAKRITGRKYSGKHGLFSLTKTDSARLVDDLDQIVKKIEPK